MTTSTTGTDTGKRWAVIGKETQISHSYHATKSEAEQVAKMMTERHSKAYIVAERKS